MNVGQYRTLLGDLELKKAELVAVHDQFAYGYAKVVLFNAQGKVQAEIDDLLSLELVPIPVVVGITATPANPIDLEVGGKAQLVVVAKMSDGATKDVSKGKYAYALYKDYDTVFNNTGNIIGSDVSAFVPAASTKYRVVKTATGWSVYDGFTDGLAILATEESDEYKIVDIDGADIGVVFTTDGTEVKGDNWNIDVTVALTGTTYATSDEAVFGVDENGQVFAVGVGTADLTITNNGSTLTYQVTVA